MVAAFTLADPGLSSTTSWTAADAANPAVDRPLASGRLPVPAAVVFAAGVAVLLAVMLAMQPLSWVWPIGTYLLLNLGYSLGLKHVALLDVFFVAAGFGLRVMLGYLALGINVSVWLLTCVFSLCLLLTMGKRRQELWQWRHRPALRGYTVTWPSSSCCWRCCHRLLPPARTEVRWASTRRWRRYHRRPPCLPIPATQVKDLNPVRTPPATRRWSSTPCCGQRAHHLPAIGSDDAKDVVEWPAVDHPPRCLRQRWVGYWWVVWLAVAVGFRGAPSPTQRPGVVVGPAELMPAVVRRRLVFWWRCYVPRGRWAVAVRRRRRWGARLGGLNVATPAPRHVGPAGCGEGLLGNTWYWDQRASEGALSPTSGTPPRTSPRSAALQSRPPMSTCCRSNLL